MSTNGRRAVVVVFVIAMFGLGCTAGVWMASRVLSDASPVPTIARAGDLLPVSVPLMETAGAPVSPVVLAAAGDGSAAVFRRGLMAGLGFGLIGAVLLGAGAIVLGGRQPRDVPDFGTSAFAPDEHATAPASHVPQASQPPPPNMAMLLQSMAAIEESSRHISGLVKTLDALAHQANLAVLSAAVEAAGSVEPQVQVNPALRRADGRAPTGAPGRQG